MWWDVLGWPSELFLAGAILPACGEASVVKLVSNCESTDGWSSGAQLSADAHDGARSVTTNLVSGKTHFFTLDYAATQIDLSQTYALAFWWRVEGDGLTDFKIKIVNHHFGTTQGAPGTAGRVWTSANYPQSGYAVLARGQGENATWLCVDYGPHGGGHGHPDKLGFVRNLGAQFDRWGWVDAVSTGWLFVPARCADGAHRYRSHPGCAHQVGLESIDDFSRAWRGDGGNHRNRCGCA